MSTSAPAPALDPNDPEFTEAKQSLYSDHPVLRALQIAGHWNLSKRLADCGHWSKLERCDEGHMIVTHGSSCGMRFACRHCAEREVEKLINRLYLLRPEISTQFIYAEIIDPRPVEVAYDALSKSMVDFCRSLPMRHAWFITATDDGEGTTVRMFYCDPAMTTEDMRDRLHRRFFHCEVSCARHLDVHYGHTIRQMFRAPKLASNNVRRAELEISLRTKRRLHISAELSVYGGKQNTDNTTRYTADAHQNCGASAHHCHFASVKACPKCQKPLRFISEWFIPTGEKLDPHQLRWTEIPLSLIRDGWEGSISPPETPPA